jgi:endo-1,4-beta-xylanase
MKTKNIGTVLLITIILASCAPVAQPTPTETAIPTATLTPIPLTPTITPTPAPENLADAKDLSNWVDDYVHAFGGKVKVNDIEMDTNQLTDEIRKNEGAFTQVKAVSGVEYMFFVVNDIPLAVRSENNWEHIPIKWLADELGLRIGTNFSTPYYDEDTRRKTEQLAISEFNHALIDSIDWWQTEPSDGNFNFSNPDRAVNLALANDMSIEGENLITPWSFRYVPYLQDYIDKVNKGEISKEQARDGAIQIMRSHIVSIMTHYKGKIAQWVVTLEQDSRGPTNGGSDMFTELVGTDYVDIAFEIARETDPQALLYYNDSYNETRNGWKYQPTLKIIRRLKEKNLVDAVGVEMHLEGVNPPNKDEIIATLKSYEIRVIISSVDINMKDVKGSPEERNQIQAQILQTIFEAAMESGVCKDFYFWEGLGDKNNWLERMDMPGMSSANADPTIFDDNLRPKPSYFALKKILFRMYMNP